MLIAYDTLMQLEPEKPYGEKCRLMACNSGMQRGILLSLDTSDFRIDYEDGKASVHLSRHLTTAQARELAAQLVRAADGNEEMERQWTTVVGTTVTPEGSVVNVVNSQPKVGHGG